MIPGQLNEFSQIFTMTVCNQALQMPLSCLIPVTHPPAKTTMFLVSTIINQFHLPLNFKYTEQSSVSGFFLDVMRVCGKSGHCVNKPQ